MESLADSVIYMAYYIIAKYVNEGRIDGAVLPPEFFDYVLLGAGTADEIPGVPADVAVEIRNEFAYFYPVDSRHSGRDLVPNHLTFFVLNHVATFPQKHWPLQIVVNGSVLSGGKKMSKSMGNVTPLRQAIREYGADPIRLTIIISAELLQDAEFNFRVGGWNHPQAGDDGGRVFGIEGSRAPHLRPWPTQKIDGSSAECTGSSRTSPTAQKT